MFQSSKYGAFLEEVTSGFLRSCKDKKRYWSTELETAALVSETTKLPQYFDDRRVHRGHRSSGADVSPSDNHYRKKIDSTGLNGWAMFLWTFHPSGWRDSSTRRKNSLKGGWDELSRLRTEDDVSAMSLLPVVIVSDDEGHSRWNSRIAVGRFFRFELLKDKLTYGSQFTIALFSFSVSFVPFNFLRPFVPFYYV